jgi:hypothetical protein
METMAEGAILETNEGGELQIPAGILGAGPHARFRLEHEGQALRLIPEASDRAWETTQPGDRVRVFHEWVTRLPKRGGPPLPAEALRRENFYD